MPVKIRTEFLQDALNRKGHSQNWLAFRLGTTSGYISQMINGCRNPSSKMREKILQIFKGSNFDDLFVTVPRKKKVNQLKISEAPI